MHIITADIYSLKELELQFMYILKLVCSLKHHAWIINV